MPTTPQITLTATLEDFTGAAAGSAANPAKLLIALCGYGGYLPEVPGTCNLSVGMLEFPSTGAPLSIPLWGNDVIVPGPDVTYYAITVVDGAGNVVQCGNYQFTGSQTIDLSNAPQYNPPPLPISPLVAVLTNPPGQALQTIDGPLTIDGDLTVLGSFNFGYSWTAATSTAGVLNIDCALGSNFAIAVHENVTSLIFSNLQPGQVIWLYWLQNGTGNWVVDYAGSAILNPTDPINPTPNGRTLQQLITTPDSKLMAPGYA